MQAMVPFLRLGQRVMIVDLKSSREFNGKWGHIETYDATLQRYGIRIDTPGSEISVLAKLRPENLACMDMQPQYIGAPRPPDSENNRLPSRVWNSLASQDASEFRDCSMNKATSCSNHETSRSLENLASMDTQPRYVDAPWPNYKMNIPADMAASEFVVNVGQCQCSECASPRAQRLLLKLLGPEQERGGDDTGSASSGLCWSRTTPR
eukprot:TRINITY_DN34475_c0_g1_i1.p1 TRINITY_DN34475_c0_g1~~TRINITY_DN34475_c0_g1_i1.p1  ORF type:complete len:208 (-),score=22.95 TRINITY_DN34475_c0_g1_i1:215-838(-)